MEQRPKTDDLKQDPKVPVQELQEFFASRDIPFGHPGCLSHFTRRLAEDPAFYEEMSSMARFVLYSVQDSGPHTELLHVLIEAVGGSSAAGELGYFREPVQTLLSFVREVMRSQRGVVTSELAPEMPVGPGYATQHATEAFSTQTQSLTAEGEQEEPFHVGLADPSISAEPVLESGTEMAASEAAWSTASQMASSRLSAALLRRHASHHEPEATVSEADPSPETAFAYEAKHPVNNSVPGRARSWLQKAYWVPGVVVLLAVVICLAYVRSRDVSGYGSAAGEAQQAAKSVPTVPGASELDAAPEPLVASPEKLAVTSSTAPAQQTAEKSSAPAATAPQNEPASQQPRARTSHGSPGSTRTRRPAAAEHNLYTSREPEALAGADHGSFAEAHEGVFLASSGSMAAHLVYAPTPSYPKLASFTRVQGQVIMQVVVARDGSVAVTRVLGGPRLLRGAAERAIRHWRYRPYVVDGKTTDVATIVTVTFKLPH